MATFMAGVIVFAIGKADEDDVVGGVNVLIGGGRCRRGFRSDFVTLDDLSGASKREEGLKDEFIYQSRRVFSSVIDVWMRE